MGRTYFNGSVFGVANMQFMEVPCLFFCPDMMAEGRCFLVWNRTDVE